MVRWAVTLLVLSAIVVGCGTKPKTHWWQFWRKPGGEFVVTAPSDLVGPPPAPVGAEGAPGAEGVVPLPGEGMPAPGTAEVLGIPLTAPERGPTVRINELQTVYFDFDSAQLRDDARQTLDANAQFLLAHPDVKVQIAGHCDERGTAEYNMSLGERRATSAREYLVTKGVPASQLTTVSYGEERPVALGSNEAAWSQNRRAEFQIY